MVSGWLIGKDPDASRECGQEEKGTTEDEMTGWHHRLDAREFEWTPGVGGGQGGLAYWDSWGSKESDTTEWLNWTDWMKEIKDNIYRWRDIPRSWAGRINILKMTILPNVIYRFNAIPIKLQKAFFTELEQQQQQKLTIHMETQKTPKSQRNLDKEAWSWRNQPSWLQTILQSYSHQDSMVWHKDRHIDQWNKAECPEISPCTYEHLIFDKRVKNIQWRNLFNKWCWESWSTTWKRMKLKHFLTAYTKINSKRIKDLNIR